jgi:anti-anti-sigma factor
MPTFGFRRTIEPAANIRALQYEPAGHPETVLLQIEGFIDNSNAPAFLDFCRDFLAGDIETFGLDLKGVSYLSSTAVGAITSLSLEARREGQRFFICSVPDKVRRVVDLLGLAETITVLGDAADLDRAPVGY